MIHIKEFPEETVDLYSPEDEFLGSLNQAQFLDVRIQINEQKLQGYYVVSPIGKRTIGDDGSLSGCMEGVFTTTITLSRKLYRLLNPKECPC